MKNTVKLCVLALMVAFTACNKSASDSSSDDLITVIHELDTVQVKKNPEKVVALDYTSLENLDAIGIKPAGIPKGFIPSHLNKFRDDASIEDLGSIKEVNFEKIAALNPDVIFISERLETSYPELKKIAPTVFLKTDAKDYIGSFKKIAGYFSQIFDKEEVVNKEIAKVEEKINQVKEKTAKSEGKGLVVMFNKGKFSAYGSGSRFGMIHDVLGVKKAVENLEVATHGQAISNEFIQQTNPDYLFIVDRGAVVDNKPAKKDDIENVLVKQTNAYKNGKVIYLDPEIWYISGIGFTAVNKMVDSINEQF